MLREKIAMVGALALAVLACTVPLGLPAPEAAGGQTPPEEAGAPGGEIASGAGDASIIFHNGTILTMNDAQPQATAIAVRGEQVLAVGGEDEVLALRGENTRVVDLGGLTLMPGFVDAHSHYFLDADVLGADEEGAQDLAIRQGVTTTTEMALEDTVNRLRTLADQGKLRVRVNVYAAYADNCGAVIGDWYKQYPPRQDIGPNLRMQGVKIWADGGSCLAPAVSFEYPNGVGQGDLFFTQAQMNQMVTDIQSDGYQLAIHALGDRAVDQVLDAIEAALGGQPNAYRHRMEHNGVVRPDQMPRYSEIGIVPVIFGAYPTCILLGDTSHFKYQVPPEYQGWEWPWRAMIDANPGLQFAWHADVPVFGDTTAVENVYGFVTRRQVRDDGSICEPPAAMAANTISADEALHIMTTGSAYALFREDEIGSLEPGKLADMIILSGNPLTIDAEMLDDLSVLMTMIGGNIEFCAEGQETLCGAIAAPAPAEAPQAAPPATGALFRDDFEGPSLEAGWSWVRENSSLWSLSEQPGSLTLRTGSGALVLAGGEVPVLLRAAPDGDFELQAKVLITPTQNFQSANIVIYRDDDHFVALNRAYCDAPQCTGDGAYLDNDELVSAAGTSAAGMVSGLPAGSPVYLRLVRQGSQYTGYWSADGQSWAEVGTTSASFAPTQVGMFAANGRTSASAIPANFDYFEIRAVGS